MTSQKCKFNFMKVPSYSSSSWTFQPISWTFWSSLWFFYANLTCDTPLFHDNGPLPLATSWTFQTNFMSLLAPYGFCILNFSTSCLLVSLSLPSRCSLVPLCFVFIWKPQQWKQWCWGLDSHKSREMQQAFEDVGHIYFRLLSYIVHFTMLQIWYLDMSKAMSVGMISKIIKHY